MTGKLIIGAVAALFVLVLDASPASAHTVTGIAATNYRSEITSISPANEPITIDLLDLGRRVRLTNNGTRDVIVYGYNGEPYLRVGPDGTFENVHSPAVYLNTATPSGMATTSTTLPPQADPNAPPKWRKRSSSSTVTWRDRRTRWEGPEPAAIAADPSTAHVAATWTIPLAYAGNPIMVTGRILWQPPPNPWAWLAIGAAALVLTAFGGFARRWGVFLHAALALLVATDVVHAFAAAAAARDPVIVMFGKVVVGGFFGAAAWIAALFCLGPLDRNSDGALLSAAACAMFIAIFGGVSDLPTLTHSQVPYAAPAGAARVAVALVIGLGIGIVTASAVVFWRHPELRPPMAAAQREARPNT